MPVQCTCRHCGTAFTALIAQVNRGRALYCSKTCQGSARRKRIACVCAHCGAAFEIKESERQYGRGLHCSKKCQDDARGRLLATFWDWVDRSDPDGCWPWTRSRNQDGYGHLRLNPRASIRAHRLAYELTYGPIPDGLVVCHRCDNPPCCRPDHLVLGTQVDNMADMVAKNRRGRDPSLKMTTACPTCGQPFTYYRSWPRKFCSNVCKGKGVVGNLRA